MITPLLNVLEVSEFLGVKPARTYELARLWELTNGREGLPCIRLGKRQLRFSRSKLESFIVGKESGIPCSDEEKEK